MTPKPLSREDMMNYALSMNPIPWERALATFAEQSNWHFEHDGQSGRWCFTGPTLPPFELAQYALNDNKT